MTSLAELDATALAELIRNGVCSSVEVVDWAIERAEALQPSLNMFVHMQFDRARADAKRADQRRSEALTTNSLDTLGAFHGVPFALKDYRGREKGEPYRMGMRALRDAQFVATSDSAFALRCRAAGLIPIGRTNVPEMALMGTTEPDAFGPTHNPWDTARSPGGSSGGSAAAVAARVVPLAHANDIAGSIRIPAAHCGVVGFKPTRARLVTSTDVDPVVGMFCEGAVSRSVRDTAALYDALTDSRGIGPWPAPRLSRSLAEEVQAPRRALRVGLCVDAFNGADVDPTCASAAIDGARVLESLGHHVEHSFPKALCRPELQDDLRTMLAVHNAAELDAWSARLGHTLGEGDVEANTWKIVTTGRAVTGNALLEAMTRVQEITRAAMSWWNDFDVLITPTTAESPTLLGDYTRAYNPGRGSAFTRVFNATGQPAISIPIGWPSDGLPRGVQMIAAYGRDDIAINVAAQLETAQPWAHRRPSFG